MKLYTIPVCILLIVSFGCIHEESDSELNYGYLKGKWVREHYEEYGTYIHFLSANEAVIGPIDATKDTMNYRIKDRKLFIQFIGHAETEHPVSIYQNDRMGIGNLTIIPENPEIIFVRIEP